ncbi:tyrosinase family protein [Rugamonas sp. A1-17]|nr:tyrosinase family protein [Rugamonas sp. A1-17]
MNHILPTLLAGLLLAGPFSAGAQDDVRPVHYRKNIDDLTPAELEAFKHAVAELKSKSQLNVYDRGGYLWQSWVHDCPAVQVNQTRAAPLSAQDLRQVLASPNRNSCDVRGFLDLGPGIDTRFHTEHPGECEHQKNTFLQWHRAQLYYFEQALQASDPDGKRGPSTRDVALPYWNFTRKPSGVRYPKAFEDPGSPLFDATRISERLPSSMATASPYLLAYQIYYMDWPEFGGDEYGSNGGGALETRIHNRMHAFYIGGNMADNATAGMDPLFYAFHNFLDYSLEKWLDEHGDAGITGDGRSAEMRAEQDDTLPKPIGWSAGSAGTLPGTGNYTPHMGQADLYFDTVKQGYGYQPPYGGEFIRRNEIQRLIDAHQGAGFVFGDNQKSLFAALLSDAAADGPVGQPSITVDNKYAIPATTGTTKRYLRLQRKADAPDYSFQADVYLHPGQARIADKTFRDRYLVSSTSHWALSGHGHGGALCIAIEVNGIINSLVPTHHGAPWHLTAAVTTNERGAGQISKANFELPVISASGCAPVQHHH